MEEKIELKSIAELQKMNFFIPSYQRGYRWTTQQVKDLLDDIHEFIEAGAQGFYCIQPLVVRERDKKPTWEVIDGQQRLTTIYILLSYFNWEKYQKYSIEYETREDSKSFLEKIADDKAESNIDYYHIVKAKEQIRDWFKDKTDEFKANFRKQLFNNVKFIWYESADEEPIKVFTRLNIGKIPLANAELIKALFLNKSNFKGSDDKKIRLQQQEIAGKWDAVEGTLQNDEFWLFLNDANYEKPTRVDFIFDLICEKNILRLNEDLGTDGYKTFRYFYSWFKQQGNNANIMDCWKNVKTLFQTFQEWFNDLELYHYVGFLIAKGGRKPKDILDNWKGSKSDFKNWLKSQIKDVVKSTKSLRSEEPQNALKFYDDKDKEIICKILLLHNIQTVINQSKSIKDDEKYKLPVFYKFPFHLFKREKWDVEHIDSNTENSLKRSKEQREWLKYSSININDKELRKKIEDFLKQSADNLQKFEELCQEIVNIAENCNNKLSDDDKQQIWNLCLLDASSNRSYGNAIFPAKRRVIIGKDQGKTISVDDDLNVTESEGAIAFIPPCTKNVFLKYYNSTTNNMREWDKEDAEAYLKNIKEVLKDFLN
jgi:hypothetical protein